MRIKRMRWFLIISKNAKPSEYAAFHSRDKARAYAAVKKAAGFSVFIADRVKV